MSTLIPGRTVIAIRHDPAVVRPLWRVVREKKLKRLRIEHGIRVSQHGVAPAVGADSGQDVVGADDEQDTRYRLNKKKSLKPKKPCFFVFG